MYLRRSEDAKDVFRTSYVRLIYTLCPGKYDVTNGTRSDENTNPSGMLLFLSFEKSAKNLCHRRFRDF